MRIYFITDAQNRVIPVSDWSASISPEQDWLDGEITEPVYETHGIPLWKYSNGVCVARTSAEVQADVEALPIPEPTEIEQMQADIDFLTMENEYLDEVTEQQQADIDYCLMLLDEE